MTKQMTTQNTPAPNDAANSPFLRTLVHMFLRHPRPDWTEAQQKPGALVSELR